MMIPILKDYYAAGYLPANRRGHIPPYLPNVNLAVRRRLIDQLGGYDEECDAGEDADLSIRASKAGWALYFDNSVTAYHEPRTGLGSLMRQWIWYGRGGSHFFFKQQRRRLEVYLDLSLVPKMHRYRCVFASQQFPVSAMMFISAFVLVHMLAVLGLIAMAVGLQITGCLLLFASLALPVFQYFRSPLRRLKGKELLLYCSITYLINWTCILATLAAGLKKRRVFLYPGI